MALISKLSRLIGGIQRQVDLSTNTIVVDAVRVGGGAGTDLTKTILDNLITLQNGSDFSTGTNAHTHDGRYYTETELGSATGTTGSDLVGDDNTYSNFTPSAATVKGALAGIDAALATAGATSFSDAAFEIYDNADATKKLVFQASGIATATTRTITMPDSNVDLGLIATAIQRNGSVAFTANQPMGGFKFTGLGAGSGAGDSVRYEQAILASGANAWAANQSLGGFKITNSADPSSAQDVATKAYVDAVAQGLKPKAAVRVATLVAGTLATSFENGDTVDGVTLATGDRILIKNQAAPAENGIYVVQATGAPVRAADFDSISPIDEINGAYTFIQEGTQAGQGWVQTGTVTVIGTDAINFVWFNSAAAIVGGDMILVTGQTISVDLATTSGLESTNPGNNAGQLRIKLEASNPSLQISGSNELGIKFDPAGALASGASGTAVQVDNSSIEINTNALRIKAAGVTLSHLASNSVDENKIVSTTFSATGAITGGSGTKVAVAVDNSSIEISANALRVKSTAYDQATITGGSGSAAAVQYAPKLQESKVAGEAFAATTLFAVRYAKAADVGFVAGRMYKADIDATTVDNFHVIGLARPAALLAAGDAITVVKMGTINVPTHGFTVGAALYLDASGAVTETATSTANMAVVKVGMVIDANNIDVQIQVFGVN